MSSEGMVIRASGLSKCYHLYERPGHRLQQFILPRLAAIVASKKHRDYYREFWALRDVSFEIARGETVGIVGRNGSGKSTLLQLLCGTLTPTQGEVEVNGRVAALLELGAGFNPDFTGRENVYLNGVLLGMSPDTVSARFDEIAAFADIGEFIDQPLKSYSSGMVVRLAFSIATHADADVLVIDEALSVGDFSFQAKCMRRLRRFTEGGGTLLFVSHDTNAVKNLCSRSIYLRRGEVRRIGQSDEVCEQYLAETNLEDGIASRPIAAADFRPAGGAGAADVAPDPAQVAEFRRLVAPFRKHGSHVCEFVAVEILDGATRAQVAMASWGQRLLVRARLQINEPVDELVVAFYLKDRLLIDVMGTNTSYEGTPLGSLRAGEVVDVEFSFTNYLRGGEYAVCLIAADIPIVTNQYFDWIDLAATLRTSDRDGQVAWATFNPGIEAAVGRRSP